MFRARAEKFRRWVRETDVVFELGVGAGWNLAQLVCARRVGSDPAQFLEARLRDLGIEFHSDPTSVPDATADVALCHQTLEHVLDPPVALRELARILKPGGRLVVHVPWERERRYARYDAAEPNHHLYTWNVQTLGNLMTTLGWRVREIGVRRYGYDRFAANAAAAWRLGEAGFRCLRRALILVRPLFEVEVVAER